MTEFMMDDDVLDLDEDHITIYENSRLIEDNNQADETPDFRFAASLISGKSGGQLPKRGEKDFEPHGTKQQESILESSRRVMHETLAYTRSHAPKNHIRAYYYGYGRGVTIDQIFGPDARQGLEDDHIVMVEHARGPHFKTIGKMTKGQKTPTLWLLPEEALYLVERGFLDLWWPSYFSAEGDSITIKKKEDEIEYNDEGTPMSLQAAYAMLIGNDLEIGKVSLDRYMVYANLRRTGYVIQRAPTWNFLQHYHVETSYKTLWKRREAQLGLFSLLFGKFLFMQEKLHDQYGPLVKPGMYRSYNQIYEQISIIPRHKPLITPLEPGPDAQAPYQVVYYLWKGDNLLKFTKKNPGNPDFRLAIVNSHLTPFLSLTQISSLLESTPITPPDSEKLMGPTKTYQRLKHGWRNVTLAVIDQGVISYIKLVEAAFGEELIYERFDKGGLRGSKHGYRRGRGGRGRAGRRI